NEVNEICAERRARNANLLTLVAAAQHYPDDTYYQAPKPIQHHQDKQHQPFMNQRTVIVVGARETIGNQVVQQSGIQCFNYKGFGHFTKECKKPKQVKDYAYHKEKMMLCKQEEKAHYMYMAKIQEVLTVDFGPIFDAEPLEKVQIDNEYNVFAKEHEHTEQPENINDIVLMEKVDISTTLDTSDMCNNDFEDDQYAVENEDERVMLANLIANLKLDIDKNKKIQKQSRKENSTLTHKLNECKSALEESNDIRDRCRSTLHHKEIELRSTKCLKIVNLKKKR
nr:hypothetical protein [Tanacetum cinerariifolium]